MKKIVRKNRPELTETKLEQIGQTLKIYKRLLPLWNEIYKTGDTKKIKRFLSLNRNPVFDITTTKYFKTGLTSKAAKNCEKCEVSNDHIIQRSKSLEYIFNELDKKPKMTVLQFAKLLRRYCSTVRLTKTEHFDITNYARVNSSYSNASLYKDVHINITGLNTWLKKNKLVKVAERIY